MKHLLKITFFLCAFSLLFSACSTDDELIDAREQFVGSYTYKGSGKGIITISGENLEIPLDRQGIFTIEKAGTASNIRIIYEDGNSEEYLVVGKSISGSFPQNEVVDDILISGIETTTGSIKGKVLTMNTVITGSVSYQGANGTISGNAIIIATKQ
jgi:hypothetical protein